MTTITREQLIEDLKSSTQNASGMFEISEDTICALMSLLTAPPAPVVPDALPENDDEEGNDIDYMEPSEIYVLGRTAGWNACRAAMLQGKAEPVSNRDELPLNYLHGHKDGLEWAARLAEANHPQTGDWLYDDPVELAKAIRKGPDMPPVESGNSPVIPDGWVLVPVELTQDMRAAWDSAPNTDDDDHNMHSGYRAMIAAAPQQEELYLFTHIT